SNRNNIANAVAGWLAQAEIGEDQAELVVQSAAEHGGDDEIKSRLRCVRDTYKKFERNEPVTGWTTLCGLIDGKAAKALRAALAVKSSFPVVNKEGTPSPKSHFNVIAAFDQLGIECKYDQFSLRYMVNGQVLEELTGELSDPMIYRMQNILFERC